MALMVLGSNPPLFLFSSHVEILLILGILELLLLGYWTIANLGTFSSTNLYKCFDNIAFNTGSIWKSILIFKHVLLLLRSLTCPRFWTEEILVAHHVRCHVQLFAKGYLFANRPHPWTFLPTDVNWMPLYGAGKVFLHLNVFKLCRIVFGFYGLRLP